MPPEKTEEHITTAGTSGEVPALPLDLPREWLEPVLQQLIRADCLDYPLSRFRAAKVRFPAEKIRCGHPIEPGEWMHLSNHPMFRGIYCLSCIAHDMEIRPERAVEATEMIALQRHYFDLWQQAHAAQADPCPSVRSVVSPSPSVLSVVNPSSSQP